MTSERWAIDANIIMQQGVSRLLSGCIEITGGQLLVPERALTLAETKFFPSAERRARRIVDNIQNPEEYLPGELRELTIGCTVAIHNAFATWARDEPQRNDGVWTIAPDSATTRTITASLLAAGIARPSTHSGVEEDAHVAAQAFAAGCRWIASHNLSVLTEDLVPWLAHEQAHGRLEHAANPFICSVDTALRTMMEDDHEGLAAITWELGRPDDDTVARDLEARLANATRFVRSLRSGGATNTADHLAPIIHIRANPDELHWRLSARKYIGSLERTRAGFRRLATTLRQATRSVLEPPRDDSAHRTSTGWERS